MWFAKEISHSRVICVEPDPNYLEIGKKNFELNQLNGEFHNFQISLNDDLESEFLCESTGEWQKVPALKLSSLIQRIGCESVDLLLADIQGAEVDLLSDLKHSLSVARFRYLIISTHDLSISGDPMTHQKCLELLKLAGANILAEHSVSESFSGDGLIVASFESDERSSKIPVTYNRAKDSLFGEMEPRLSKEITLNSEQKLLILNFESLVAQQKLLISSLENELVEKEKVLDSLESQFSDENEVLKSLQIHIDQLRFENLSLKHAYESITSSTTWRMTSSVRQIVGFFKRLAQKVGER